MKPSARYGPSGVEGAHGSDDLVVGDRKPDVWSADCIRRNLESRILGVLIEAVVHEPKTLADSASRSRLPPLGAWRGRSALACKAAIWSTTPFWSGYCGNRDEAIANVSWKAASGRTT